jgi:hypothetical protein
MTSNVTPSMPGAPLFAFAAAYAVRSVSSLPTWTDQSPEAPGRFSLRLGVDPPLQVLQTNGRCCHGVPASPVPKEHEQWGPLAPAACPRLRRYSGPLRHPLVFDRFPGGCRLYGLPCSSGFLAGTRTVSPVASRVLVTVLSLPPRRSGPSRQPACDGSCGLHPPDAGRPPGRLTFGATTAFPCGTAR